MRIIEARNGGAESFINSTLKRGGSRLDVYEERVRGIIEKVVSEGDRALFEFTKAFDKIDLDAANLMVSRREMEEAYSRVPDSLIDIFKESAANIRAFHQKQVRESYVDFSTPGVVLGQKLTPIERVGIYVPGGTASYPSTVLMCAVTASVAGVGHIAMATPGGGCPECLVAADIAGVDSIYRIGGAQAIAALAYGTESVPRVDKIVGPGNIYVALAKKMVFGQVSIDSVAGPSEICVIADENANPAYVAADLLSQAEHDEMAACVLLTDSRKLAESVAEELKQQRASLSRRKIIDVGLDNNGAIIIARDTAQCLELANAIAPEHLEIMTQDPFELLPLVKNAGAVFLGSYSPEPLGDYFAGPNHVLPTGGGARFFSPLCVDDFVKKTSVISYSQPALRRQADKICAFAVAEGLFAHAKAVEIRKSCKREV